MDENALIRRAAAGDLEAFEAVVRVKRERVVRIAWHILGDRELARDVAQEVFVRLFRVIGRFKEGGRFDTWLHRITLNLAIDAFRRERPHRGTVPIDTGGGPEMTDFAGAGPQAGASPADRLAAGEVRRIFVELSATLPPKQRAAFVLREIEGLPTEEVAAIMKTSASTVRNHVLLARRSLQDLLRGRYPEYCRS
jgi:RNA polymerase sigma-70 factor (ECF subfamily)